MHALQGAERQTEMQRNAPANTRNAFDAASMNVSVVVIASCLGELPRTDKPRP